MADTAAGDLAEINPEAWQNIPLPLKRAIGLLTQKVLQLDSDIPARIEESFKRVESALQSSCEGLDARIKKVARSLASQSDSWASASRRLGEGLSALEVQVEKVEATAQSELAQVASRERKEREQTAALHSARLADLDGKVSGLQNFLSSTASDLKTAVSGVKSSVRYEIEEFLFNPGVKGLREEIEQVALAIGKVEQALAVKIEGLEEFQQETIREKLESEQKLVLVDEAVEMTQPSLPDIKPSEIDISDQVSAALSQALSQAVNPLSASLASLQEALQQASVTHAAEMSSLRSDLEALLASKSTQSAEAMQRLEDSVAAGERELELQVEELGDRLGKSIDEKEKAVLSQLQAALRPLERRLEKFTEQFSESEMQSIRQKLAVRHTQWLPLDISDLRGMSPTEARLYTLEARLRNEENKRIQAIEKMAETIKALAVRPRRAHTADRAPTALTESLHTPTMLRQGDSFKTAHSPGGMPKSHSPRKRKVTAKSDLAIRSIARKDHSVPLLNPFDATGTSQREILSIYKEFSPTVYSGRSTALGCTKDLATKYAEYEKARRGVLREDVKSLPGSREGSPQQHLRAHEAVQFERLEAYR